MDWALHARQACRTKKRVSAMPNMILEELAVCNIDKPLYVAPRLRCQRQLQNGYVVNSRLYHKHTQNILQGLFLNRQQQIVFF